MVNKLIHKKLLLAFILLNIGLLIAPKIWAANIITDTTYYYVLKADNGKHTKTYKQGDFIKVEYMADSNKKEMVKGMLLSIDNNSITIKPFKKKQKPQVVLVDNIYAVQKLHVKARKGWKPLLAVLVILTILGLIYIDTYGAIIFLAAPAVSLFTVLPFLLGSFSADIISKKSKAKGWSFSIVQKVKSSTQKK